MQGYGLFVLEELVYSPTGTTYTRGPGTYKIPGFADIPVEFNVSLLKGAPNPRAVYSSKVSKVTFQTTLEINKYTELHFYVLNCIVFIHSCFPTAKSLLFCTEIN